MRLKLTAPRFLRWSYICERSSSAPQLKRDPLGGLLEEHTDMLLDFVVHGEHRDLLAEEIARYEEDPEVLALMLQGSVARGEAAPRSDLDLFVLLRDGCSRPFSHEIRRG